MRLTRPLHRPRPVDGGRRLVFGPAAWLKWQYLCHAGPTEVAGFGLSAPADPLYLTDVLVVRQRATAVTVAFDDAAVADLFDAMADAGVPPGRFARVWLHTHPGATAVPSPVDEATFDRVFGRCDWAVMAILGRTGRTTARLRFAAGPGAALALQTAVDWADWPAAAADPDRSWAERVAGWNHEYTTWVEKVQSTIRGTADNSLDGLLERSAVGWDDFFLSPFPPGGMHDLD
jgi:hypothetical protein